MKRLLKNLPSARKAMLRSRRDAPPIMRALCISLATAAPRRQAFEKAVPACLEWSFLEATDGDKPAAIAEPYRRLLPARFWNRDFIRPGAFGCFVSHYRAWEACAKSGEDLLVLEDDTQFNADAEATLREMLGRTEEVLFLNRRAVLWHLNYQVLMGRKAEPVRPLGEVMLGLVRADTRPLDPRSVGGDCYRITPQGARRLIDLADRFGAAISADWFMAASGCGGAMPMGRWKFPAKAVRAVRPETPLDVGVARSWVAGSAKRSGSAIRASGRANLGEYKARMSGQPYALSGAAA